MSFPVSGNLEFFISSTKIFLSPVFVVWLCLQSYSHSVSLRLHTDMEQHHHPVHDDHHHPHEVTADSHPLSFSSDAIILVIFLLACVALGLGIKLVVVLLRRSRWVSASTSAGGKSRFNGQLPQECTQEKSSSFKTL